MSPSLQAVACLVALVSFGCSGTDGGEASLESPPEEWRLADTVRIGSVDGPADALSRVGALLPMSGGGAWFTQPTEQQIRIVDSDGGLVEGIGGQGQGPGEFTTVGALGFWQGAPDTVWVMDWVLRRISLFGADGSFLRTVPLPEVEWGDRWSVEQPRAVGPDGAALALGRYPSGAGVWDQGFPIVRFALADGEVLGEVARVERTDAVQIQWEDEVVASGAHPMPDSPIVSVSVDGAWVVITERDTDRDGADPHVRITALGAEGDTAWQRSLAYAPEAIPQQELDSIWGERIEGFRTFAELEGRLDPDEAEQAYRASVPPPSHRPPVEAVRVDTGGRVVLVWSAAPGEGRTAWLIGPEGELVAAFEVPGGQELLSFEGGYVWALEQDTMDVPFVIRYRVDEGA